MKRIFAFVLAMLMVLSLAACKDNATDNTATTAATTGKSKLTTAEKVKTTAATTAATEATTTEATEPDPVYSAVLPLQIDIGTHNRVQYGSYDMTANVTMEHLRLQEYCAAQLPALSERFEEFNRDSLDFMQAKFEECVEYAALIPEEAEGSICITYNQQYKVQRADNLMVSILSYTDAYYGLAHPGTILASINLDSQTGEDILLKDVVTDVDTLLGMVYDKLIEKYTKEAFFDIDTYFDELDPETLVWTLGYDGITIRFNEYELAPYALGTPVVTVWFSEDPSLFYEEYLCRPADGYAVELIDYLPYEFDRDPDDGVIDTIAVVESVPEEEGYSAELYIDLNGRIIPDRHNEFFAHNAWLVCLGDAGDNRYYLYAATEGYFGYSIFVVYDLNGEEPVFVGSLDGHSFPYYWEPLGEDMGLNFRTLFNDPGYFTLTASINLLGSMSGNALFQADSQTGMPVNMTGFYELPEDFWPLVTKMDIEVTAMPSEEPETIPAGTELFFLRTDGESYVDVKKATGEEYRLTTWWGEDGLMVNGYWEFDAFEDIYYAN